MLRTPRSVVYTLVERSRGLGDRIHKLNPGIAPGRLPLGPTHSREARAERRSAQGHHTGTRGCQAAVALRQSIREAQPPSGSA